MRHFTQCIMTLALTIYVILNLIVTIYLFIYFIKQGVLEVHKENTTIIQK